MSDSHAFDPFALARAWMGQWESWANATGQQWLGRPETARAMQAMSGAALAMRSATVEASERMLALANLPTRANVEALAARLAAVDAALIRIEALLPEPADPCAPSRPAVRRTRRPPQVG